MLSLLLERMKKKDLLKAYSSAVDRVRVSCQRAFLRDGKSAKFLDSALGPLIVIMREASKYLDSSKVMNLFRRLLTIDMTSNQTSKYNSATVRKSVFIVLGLICRNFKEAVEETKLKEGSEETSVDAFMRHLCSEISSFVRRGEQNAIITGCLEGLSALLDSFKDRATSFKRSELVRTAYNAACKSISAAADKESKRYMLAVASLDILANHCDAFVEFFHCQEHDSVRAVVVCEKLLACADHTNADVRQHGLKALDSWLGCIRIGLSAQDQAPRELLKLFLDLTNEDKPKRQLAAIRGFGALASTMVEIGEVDTVRQAFASSSNFVERMLAVDQNDDSYHDVMSQLPDLVVGFSDMLSELPQVSSLVACPNDFMLPCDISSCCAQDGYLNHCVFARRRRDHDIAVLPYTELHCHR